MRFYFLINPFLSKKLLKRKYLHGFLVDKMMNEILIELKNQGYRILSPYNFVLSLCYKLECKHNLSNFVANVRNHACFHYLQSIKFRNTHKSTRN